MSDRFLQIHTLTSYPASLLNRDDAGFAKRMPFGGATRTRVSSQCLKRHWRSFQGDGSLRGLTVDGEPVPFTVRSRRTFEREIKQPLIEDGVPADLAHAITEALMDQVLEKSAKRAKAEKEAGEEGEGGERLHTGQVIVLGRPEVEFLLDEARQVASEADDAKAAKKAVKERFKKEARKNLQALKDELGAGLDGALFGRMVTSDILARTDAAIHVAHALTVHSEMAETDYFSAVDDLLEDEETGSGHLGSTELTSGLFYTYVAVDIPLLVSNLEGVEADAWTSADRELAAAVVERLVRIIATVSPGAKLGSTAPHSYAHLVLAEAGDSQPRTLANAFLEPVSGSELVGRSYEALARHIAALDSMYGPHAERSYAALEADGALEEVLGSPGSLAQVASWAAERVKG